MPDRTLPKFIDEDDSKPRENWWKWACVIVFALSIGQYVGNSTGQATATTSLVKLRGAFVENVKVNATTTTSSTTAPKD